jgi:hypothetical protein
MYRFLALSCLVAIAFGDCGKVGWGLFKDCIEPTIKDMKPKMEQYRPKMDQCLKDANCVLPAPAAQEKINATLLIGCFKKHFSIIEKVEQCTCKSVPTFVMPDIEQLGFNGDGDDFQADALRMRGQFAELMKDKTSKCNVTQVGLCLKDASGGNQQKAICQTAQSCIKSSFKDCDINNAKVVLCSCSRNILSDFGDEIATNATGFHQCIGKPLPNGADGDKVRQMFRSSVEKKINDICNVNFDTMCDQSNHGLQANATAGSSPSLPAPLPSASGAKVEVEAGAKNVASAFSSWHTGK